MKRSSKTLRLNEAQGNYLLIPPDTDQDNYSHILVYTKSVAALSPCTSCHDECILFRLKRAPSNPRASRQTSLGHRMSGYVYMLPTPFQELTEQTTPAFLSFAATRLLEIRGATSGFKLEGRGLWPKQATCPSQSDLQDLQGHSRERGKRQLCRSGLHGLLTRYTFGHALGLNSYQQTVSNVLLSVIIKTCDAKC